MVTVRILGGLGNQLFQYAFGRALALRKNTDLCLNYYEQITRTDFDGENLTKIVDVFDLPVKTYIGQARKDFINRCNLTHLSRFIERVYLKTKCVITEDDYASSQEKINRNKDIELFGYWQSERYFIDVKDTIRKDLKFKIEEEISRLDIYKEIGESDSVSLHIRGKDYLINPFFSKCDIKYYLDAVDIIRKSNPDIRGFIFTDDVDNVHQNYKELLKFSRIIDISTNSPSDEVDLLLMSKCKHNVIANSSFSWWGAWLNNNPHKIVIAPQKWFKSTAYSSENLIPAGWLRI